VRIVSIAITASRIGAPRSMFESSRAQCGLCAARHVAVYFSPGARRESSIDRPDQDDEWEVRNGDPRRAHFAAGDHGCTEYAVRHLGETA
jgi:hypothetical protein